MSEPTIEELHAAAVAETEVGLKAPGVAAIVTQPFGDPAQDTSTGAVNTDPPTVVDPIVDAPIQEGI